MLSHCVKCKNNTVNKSPKVSMTSNVKMMLLAKCAGCNSKYSRVIKEQEASKLLSKLEIRTPLSKISLLGDILT